MAFANSNFEPARVADGPKTQGKARRLRRETTISSSTTQRIIDLICINKFAHTSYMVFIGSIKYWG